jgi:FdhE protein
MFWQKPGCPVCGSPPVLSILDADGNRNLICEFCWSQWGVPRIRCPFCLETDSRKLHYKSTDQEKEYRIDVCDSCRSYVKTVDIRELDRPFYAPLESIVTAHLDVLMENYRAV